MKNLRIASFILPCSDNDGDSTVDAHAYAEQMLLKEFGGFTTTPVKGKWADDHGKVFTDISVKYEVAVDTAHSFGGQLLRQIATMAAIIAKQDAVFVVIDGYVSIVKTI